nr:ets DNA-binding protein pokkuri-like isoform X2 [Procambarus clarkii]
MMHTLLYSEMNQAVPGGVSMSPGHEGGYGECQVPSPSQWSDPCYSPPSFHSPQHLPGELEKVKEEPFSPSPPSNCGTLPPSPPAPHRASPYARPQPNLKKEGFEASLSLSELLAENQVLANVHPQAALYAPYPDHPLLRGRLEDNTFQKKMAALPYKSPSPSSMNDGLGFLDMLVDVKQEEEEEVSVGSSCGSPAVPANNHATSAAVASAAAAAAACQRDILETVEQLALEHARRDVQRVSDSLNIPRDPALWSVDDVRAWLNLQATQLHLPPLMLNFWNLGGPALLKLTEAQFRQLAPVGGELLYAQLEIWRGALRAAPKLPQYQYRYRLYPDPIIIHQQQQCHQQVPQTTQLENSGQIGSPGQQLGSHNQQLGSPGQQLGSHNQQLGSPGQQLGSPNQQLGSHNHQLGSPGQQLGSPGQQLGSPGQQLGSPSQQLGSPGQQLGSPGQQLGSPGQQLGSPGQQLGSPNQQLGSHNQQLGSPGQQLGSPGQQLGSPGQQLGSPGQQLGSPGQQLGSPGQQLGSPGQQLGSPGQQLGPSGQQLCSPNQSSPSMSLTTNLGQVPTPVVQVTQHLQAGGTGSCQPQTGTPSPQPSQQQASGGVYLEEQCLEMTTLLQQQASSPKAAHTTRVPAHSPQDDAYDSDEEVEDEVCGGSSGSGGRGGTHIHLWQFLKELLQQPQLYGSCIRWLDRQKGVFKIEDSVRVARLWGKRKNRPAMNYDKLSRSIRQYYKKGIMKKTERSQRLVYQFCHPYCL